MKTCDLCKSTKRRAVTMQLIFQWDSGVLEKLGDPQDLCNNCSRIAGEAARKAVFKVFTDQQKKEGE